MRRLSFAFFLVLAFHVCAFAQLTLTGAGKNVAAVGTPFTISCAGSALTSSTVACSGTYTGTAPSSFSSAVWQSPCSGSVTPPSATFGGGTWGPVNFPTPSGACTGVIVITTNLSTSNSSGAVAIGYTGAGDIVSGADQYFSCTFAYNAAYGNGTNKACQIQRASDSATFDMVALTSGYSDVAGATTFCSATTCGVRTMYHQAGSGADLAQTTQAQQLVLVFNCVGSLPCVRNNGSKSIFAGSAPAASQPISMISASSRTGSLTSFSSTLITGACLFGANVAMGYSNSVNIAVTGHVDSDELRATATDNQLNALIGVVNGASSSTTVNGSTTSGSLNSNNPDTSQTVVGGDGCSGTVLLTGDILEVGRWPSIGFNSTQITNMNANMRARGGY